MAIRFTDKPASAEPRRKPAREPAQDEGAGAQGAGAESAGDQGAARFATPIEATTPVNPDAAAQLPFGDLPPAEKAERKKRAPRAAPRK